MNDTTSSLFRTEALESIRPSAYGRIILVRPPSITALTTAAVLIGAAVVLFFIFGRYSRQVTLGGQLVPSTGFISVHSPGGTVVEQHVTAGDEVEMEQVLYVVSPGEDTKGKMQPPFIVRAPARGTAVTVGGAIGETVDATRPLVTIMPHSAQLEARLLAPSRAIGLVRTGNEVVLRYDAFPYQRFGHHRGVLQSVSRSAVVIEQPAPTLHGANEPMYLMRVALPSQSVTVYGEPRRLLAGMTVQAQVLQESRRLYEWVLEPLYSKTGRPSSGAGH